MRSIGIDQCALRIEIDRADMQRLVQVADEMSEQEQRLLLVADRKGRLWRLVGQDRDHRIYRGGDLMRIGAKLVAIVAVALNRDVVEMIGVVAALLESGRMIGAIRR